MSETICGLSVGFMWRVGRVFLCRVYIASNRRLVRGSLHVVN
jgi:hypothetical protein